MTYIFRRPDNTLYKTLRNIGEIYANVTNLASGTKYYATVSAVYVNSAGETIESAQSTRENFKTGN